MKIMLLGADGQVGWHLRGTLTALGTVVAVTRHGQGDDRRCDLSDERSVVELLQDERPALVVNAAAYTAVDRAENDETAASLVNSDLPGVLGRTVAAWKGAVIHYSTDYVFNGRSKRPYIETDATAPLNVYGRSKLAGERALAASGVRHLILRTAWVYSLRGRNFLTTMLRLARNGDELRVVDDQYGTPTSAPMLADATTRIAAKWLEASGASATSALYHLTPDGQTTWFGFANAIISEAARRGLLHATTTVSPMTTAEYPTAARRPAFSVLCCDAIDETFVIRRHHWCDDLCALLDQVASSS